MKYRNGNRVFLKTVRPDDQPIDIETRKDIEGYFRTCLSAVESESTAKFVESLANQWDKDGWLSEAQFKRLRLIHDDL